ncbi:MAG: FHA domain-containing protein [Thermodesulfobacteriota bacterium]
MDERIRSDVITPDQQDKGDAASGDTDFKVLTQAESPGDVEPDSPEGDPARDVPFCPHCQGELEDSGHICPSCDAYLGLCLRVLDKVHELGRSHTLEMEVQNRSAKLLHISEMRVSCDGFREKESGVRPPGKLQPGGKRKAEVPVVPVDGDELLARFQLAIRDDSGQAVAEGARKIFVRNVSSEKKVRIEVGGDLSGADLGGLINSCQEEGGNQEVEIKIVGDARGVDINPLVFAPRKNVSPPQKRHPEWLKLDHWIEVPLYIYQEFLQLDKGKSTPTQLECPSELKNLSDIKSAWLRPLQPEKNRKVFRLFFKPKICMGRGDHQDIPCKVFNRAGNVLKKQTQSISSEHLTLWADSFQTILEDHSTNGTLVGEKRVQGERCGLSAGDMISLAGVLAFRYREFRDLSELYSTLYKKNIKTTLQRASHLRLSLEGRKFLEYPLCAIRLKPVGIGRDVFEYFIVPRQLDIGSGHQNALKIDHPSVSNMHARLLVSDQGVRLLDLESDHGTFINGRRLNNNEACLLSAGCLIRFGELEVELDCDSC